MKKLIVSQFLEYPIVRYCVTILLGNWFQILFRILRINSHDFSEKPNYPRFFFFGAEPSASTHSFHYCFFRCEVVDSHSIQNNWLVKLPILNCLLIFFSKNVTEIPKNITIWLIKKDEKIYKSNQKFLEKKKNLTKNYNSRGIVRNCIPFWRIAHNELALLQGSWMIT